MAKRSLVASSDGIQLAKQAFKRKGWTQEHLAAEIGLQTRQPIWKFFSGKPIYRSVFVEICFALDLAPEDIALSLEEEPLSSGESTSFSSPFSPQNDGELDHLVKQIRQAHSSKIQHQCGILHILDVTRPIELEDIYVDVNILPEIPHRRWREIADFPSASEYARLSMGQGNQQRIPAIEAVEEYKQLVILGQPGAGKTTFLQALAMQCDRGTWRADLIPIFISLKNFAEDHHPENPDSFLNYLLQVLALPQLTPQTLDKLLQAERILLLLDGLDEIPAPQFRSTLQKIRRFFEQYYQTPCLISCRPAAYQYRFREFTEIEIANFTEQQVKTFVHKFFAIVPPKLSFHASTETGQKLAEKFLQQIKKPENRLIRELAKTPILLNLTCLVFQVKGEFPQNTLKLYEQSLDILLVRWDEVRGIERRNLPEKFSLAQKLSLLSHLAYLSLEKDQYFLESQQLQHYIIKHCCQFDGWQGTPEEIRIKSQHLLQHLESHHGIFVEQAQGIYSFSHLTFQEYLASRWLAHAEEDLRVNSLVNHLYESNWRNIFLLTVALLPQGDSLLLAIQNKIQQDIVQDDQCIAFLAWVQQQTHQYIHALQNPDFAMILSGILFSFGLFRNLRLAQNSLQSLTLATALVQDILLRLDLPRLIQPQSIENLGRAWLKGRELAMKLGNHSNFNLSPLKPAYFRVQHNILKRDLQSLCDLSLDSQLPLLLSPFEQELPSSHLKTEALQEWWESQGIQWVQQFQQVLQTQGYIPESWQWCDRQQQALFYYYDAQVLLLECLERARDISPATRSTLYANLFRCPPS